jgi:predicted dehydrogenase
MIRLAMLSCGHVHTKGYCDRIAERDDCSLAVVWDDMAERGRQFASDYDAEYSADLAGTVGRDDLDGFVICAENTRHLPLLQAAVPAGKPIFCEKPFATTVADAQAAMALIREHDAPVFMGYVQPFTAALQSAAKQIADGALGTVTHVRFRNAHHAAYGRWFDSPANAWFTDPDLAGGGAFMDMGTHAVHAVRTLFGPVDQVFATIRNMSGEYPNVDDHGLALLRFASGVLGTVEASWIQTGGPGGLEVTGSKATLFRHPTLGYATAEPREEPVKLPDAPEKPSRVERLIAAVRGELSAQELAEDLQAAADAVAIMEACYQSSGSGGWVSVPVV